MASDGTNPHRASRPVHSDSRYYVPVTSFSSSDYATSASSPALSYSSSSKSFGTSLVEPMSPDTVVPDPNSSLTRSSAHQFTSPSTTTSSSSSSSSSHPLTDHRPIASAGQPRIAQDGSNLWSEGMRNLIPSLIGAPPSKYRHTNFSPHTPSAKKSDSFDPVCPSEVEATTSIWDIPRDTIAMTMGFSGSTYDEQQFAPPVWQSQVSAYSTNDDSSSNFPATYSGSAAPSGLAIAEAPRSSRPGMDFPLLSDPRQYSRRIAYPHSRSFTNEASFNTNSHARTTGSGEAYSNSSTDTRLPGIMDGSGNPWWPATVHDQSNTGQPGDSNANSNSRRINPPPLPETRGSARASGGWPGASSSSSSSMGFDVGAYEFPQSSLGKRQYDDDSISSENVADPSSRRFSLAPNMVFSRPLAAPISSMINYRQPPIDPRRGSMGNSDPSYSTSPTSLLQQPTSRQYSSSAGWSSWTTSPHPSGLSAGISSTSPNSSPAVSGWKENMRTEGFISPISNPTAMSNSSYASQIASNKRHRRQSSASGSSSQNNLLANTPYQITTEIVLRAPPASKMQDVYYDQHCEIQTGMPDPPASDFEVANEEDRPRLQTDKMRFPGDLYTPRWVRGTGNAREAWCDRCENGNWLQLKNSQYWYDQVHKHGISSVSGLRFTSPTHLKMYADAAGTVEGKCHQCKEWVLICTAKRRRNFSAFFKHAHACHSYRKASTVGNGPIVEHNPGGYRKKSLNLPI